jgi:hypothetical protein
MTKSKIKKLINELETRVWESIKQIFQLEQLYQRQPFGRMTAVKVMQQKEFITN